MYKNQTFEWPEGNPWLSSLLDSHFFSYGLEVSQILENKYERRNFWYNRKKNPIDDFN